MGTTLLLLLSILLHLSPTSNSQAVPPKISYTFSSFDTSNQGNFDFSSNAIARQGALQITPDTLNSVDYLVNKSGRVFLNDTFKLWQNQSNSNSTTKRINASFNTTFSVNIFRQNNTIPGEGLAFLIAPNLDEPPIGSYGGYIGLTNKTLDGSASNHIVAIELDTVKQSYDPDDNHIGLNINSVVSNVTASLTPFGIGIAPINAANYTVWIDYDGVSRHLWVYITFQNRPKPTEAVLNASLDLSDYILQKSYFGFAASTGSDFELNCVLAWNITVEKLPEDESNDGDNNNIPAWKWVLMVGLPLVAVVVISGVVVWSYLIKRRKVGDDDPIVLAGRLKSLPGTPREFEFKALRKATNNFDERMKLGQGGFGIVYKGVIPGENTEVAVKKFSRDNIKGRDDFLAELSIINRLRHKHLVRLLGWCHKNGMLLLVYDYMPNGSLDQHLFGGPLLNWHRRYNIISGVASALHYLHNEYDQKVVHRDLKASNVLLDSAFNARLGDFGLARALETDKTSYVELDLDGVPGTVGYIAPECLHTGKATQESDIFGFGAVVLEVVCGRRPRCDISGFQFLADWVWKLHREHRILEAVDPRLDGEFVREDALRLLLLGLACSHPTPQERPKTAGIVQIVSRSVAPPVVPPFKPAFVWPSGHADDEDSSSRVTSTVVTSSYYASSPGMTPRSSDMFMG